MKWYPYGHDFGNSEIGGVTVIDGKNESLSIPTAFSKADINAMRNLGVKMDQSNMHIIQFYGEAIAYAVGELALQQAVDVYHGRGDIQRYSSKYSLRALLAVAAALIPDTEFGLYVVTGLPAETYIKNSTLRSNIKTALDGTHVFSTDHGRTLRSVDKGTRIPLLPVERGGVRNVRIINAYPGLRLREDAGRSRSRYRIPGIIKALGETGELGVCRHR